MTIACQIVASLGALRAMFGSPPDSAKLQAWWHWMDDSYTPETLRADIDAMAALGIGAAHVFEPGAYFPIRRFWCRMMSDEWLLRFDSALALAKERGIALGFHNCPGWSSSGGPWIDYAHSMKIVVAGCVDLSGSERSVVVPCSKAVVGGFHRDISLLAVQIPDDPGPSRASRAFPTTLRIAEKGSADSMVFEFDGGVPPVGTMILEWADGSHQSVVDVESSADGLVWRLLGRHHLMYYNSPLTPKTVSFDEPSPGDRFIRVTFCYVESPAHVRHKDVVLNAVSFSSIRHVDDLDDKAGLRGHGLAYRPPADGKASLPGLDAGTMRNISKFMDGDGRVDLVAAGLPAPAPGRRWRLLRLGFTSTGKKCSPSTLQGLECDKLDRSGIEAHWPHMPARLAARPGAKGTLKYCIIDSYEAGGQNWTDDMPAKFSRLRGYDMMRYLPALVGYVVGSVGETEKFLYDFQRTIADLFVCEYYGRFAELCRGEGLVPVVEGYDGTFDPMEACAAADIPCGEFWIGGTGASNAKADKTPTWAASAAHLKGSAIVAAESFTTGAKEGRWQTTPVQLPQHAMVPRGARVERLRCALTGASPERDKPCGDPRDERRLKRISLHGAAEGCCRERHELRLAARKVAFTSSPMRRWPGRNAGTAGLRSPRPRRRPPSDCRDPAGGEAAQGRRRENPRPEAAWHSFAFRRWRRMAAPRGRRLRRRGHCAVNASSVRRFRRSAQGSATGCRGRGNILPSQRFRGGIFRERVVCRAKWCSCRALGRGERLDGGASGRGRWRRPCLRSAWDSAGPLCLRRAVAGVRRIPPQAEGLVADRGT